MILFFPTVFSFSNPTLQYASVNNNNYQNILYDICTVHKSLTLDNNWQGQLSGNRREIKRKK